MAPITPVTFWSRLLRYYRKGEGNSQMSRNRSGPRLTIEQKKTYQSLLPPLRPFSRFVLKTPHTVCKTMLTQDLAFQILCTILYVAPFYLSSKTRPSPQLSRDAPTVIRARIRSVTFSCIFASLMTWYIAREKGHFDLEDTLEVLGWWPINIKDIGKSLALVVILFAGPLFEAGIAAGQWKDWITGRYLVETLGSSVGWRNYIAVRTPLCPVWYNSNHIDRVPSPKKSCSDQLSSLYTSSRKSPRTVSSFSHLYTLVSHISITSTNTP